MLRSVGPRLVVYDAGILPEFPAMLAAVLPGARALAVSGPSGDYEGLLATAPDRESTHPIDPESLAAIGFTSGTTGRPKGITATHGALAESARISSR